MTRGIYSAASGMLAEETAQQFIAQNLANASTTGYKQDNPTFKSFDETMVSLADDNGTVPSPIGTLGHGADVDHVYTDLSDGLLQETGNKLDVALRGDAFLGIQNSTNTDYSRDGALTISPNGNLIQVSTGLPVLSDRRQTIAIPQGGSVSIDQFGDVSVDGKLAGRIGLFSIKPGDNPIKLGDNLLGLNSAPAVIDPSKSPSPLISSGYLEASNVSIVKEMVTMITCLRSYEANQKILKSQDDTQGQAVSEISKVA